MKGKYVLIIATFLMFYILPSATFGFGKIANSDAILADMYANPDKYIRYGGASIGLSFLIDKTSINVHKYNPPEYIISVREITHYNSGRNDKYEQIEYDGYIRYRYDYAKKRMYKEVKDNNGILKWELVDPSASKSYHDDNWVSLGEIMFYLAYNMSFYDKPIIAKEFINDGLSGLPMTKLPNGGDNMIWHYYNHRTKQIEWWKHTYDKRTKKDGFVRVK